MAKYFIHCEKHGRINGLYDNPNDAAKARRDYIRNGNGSHGKVSIIEVYEREKYGYTISAVRKFRG